MTTSRGMAVTPDALRGYIKTLRQRRGWSQDKLAKAMEWSRRAYIDWETGGTKDIKAPQLVRGILALGGSFDQVAAIPEGSTFEDGERIANDWLYKEPRILEAVREIEESPVSHREKAAQLLQIAARMIREGKSIDELLPPGGEPPDQR